MKELNFKEWLESQGVDTKEFWEQCKMKNQGWSFEDKYHKRNKLKDNHCHFWVTDAFKWDKTEQGFFYWDNIDRKWENMVKRYEINGEFHKIEFGFGKE